MSTRETCGEVAGTHSDHSKDSCAGPTLNISCSSSGDFASSSCVESPFLPSIDHYYRSIPQTLAF
jgi:hypothetical protein